MRSNQRGISLVEIMVAMAIGLVIVLIATTVYTQGVSNFSFRMGQSENLGNSRYALDILDAEFTKAGYRRDPTQPMIEAFPVDPTANANKCKFAKGQAIYLTATGELCTRFQARDNNEKDCAGGAAGIAALSAYEQLPTPSVGTGMFVEKFFVENGKLICQPGADSTKTAVADGVRDMLVEYGVGKSADSLSERKVESYKTTAPAADEDIRSLRYSILLVSTSGGVTGGMESTVCTRWANLGGASASCDTSKGQLYQIATGSLTLRNLMP